MKLSRKISVLTHIVLFFSFLSVSAQTALLSYYLPDSVQYDPSVPVPATVLGHQVGEMYATHDHIVEYMRAVAAASPRVTIEEYGRTYENRPLLYVVITAEENAGKVEEMRKAHLQLSDPAHSADVDIRKVPLVVLLSYTVHGNEASGANASLLTVYHLAAARNKSVKDFLKNTIVLVDPCINPDGYSRFSEWVNSRRSFHPSTDPVSDEFNEPWPGGRTNHYWYDMNRDYTLLVNRESRARVKQFYRWRPNIVTDHHEMGSSSTFFFQPGIPSRNNPMTPGKNYKITGEIAAYHARFLDRLGSLYYTEESYDDYYYGKGSSFPDINGGIGILFEQGSSRGLSRQTKNGLLTFPFGIRNQFSVSLSTLAAANDLRQELPGYQRDFFASALQEARKDPVKGYVFGDADDITRTDMFVHLLREHQIQVYPLRKQYQTAGRNFLPSSSWVVPAAQPQYRMIRTLFEKMLTFRDSTFYDVSTWTFPLAFNMPCAALKEDKTLSHLAGDPLTADPVKKGELHGEASRYGYLFSWNEFNTPRLLYRILSSGLRAKVAMSPFTYDDGHLKKHFPYGTIFVPVQNQPQDAGRIYALLKELSATTGVDIYPVSTGLTPAGIDLGSRNMSPLKKPVPVMLTGPGVSSSEAGEIWSLFDLRYDMPLTMVDVSRAGNIDLGKYNVLILPGGRYSALSTSFVKELRAWIAKGGTVIALKSANRWLASQKLTDIEFKAPARPDSSHRDPYETAYKKYLLQRINGAIFRVTGDLSHPLCYGYTRKEIPVFVNSTLAAKPGSNVYGRPVMFTVNPLLSGYASAENIRRIQQTPYVIVHSTGRGRVISFMDDPNFRGYFYGTMKMFANALLFRNQIRDMENYTGR